ncbi:hypothetical protein B0H14DRAFT_3522106 [Mycena olivaceomarginata]|nr:hypothetical protein B0H14DRAFT_3522106 [Mycena olivaceomarginata]
MYTPYVSAAVRSAEAQRQAALAQQAEWLENAIHDGPLPTHDPRPDTRIGDLRDADPSPTDLRAAQEELALANRAGTLLTFRSRHDTAWSPCNYPSTITSQYEIYRQPSGFKNLQDHQLPLCPHYANPGRTDFECRMRARSHRRHGETITYLQVPPVHHECSFIAIIRSRERRLLFPQTSQLGKDEVGQIMLTPSLSKRQISLKRGPHSKSVKHKPSFQASAKAQMLGRPLQRHNALALIGGTGTASPTAIPPHVVVNLGGDDDMSPPPYSSSSALPRRRIPRVIDRYTDEEAHFNLVGDAELLALTLAAREEIYRTREYETLFWLFDGPNGPCFDDERFPTRLRPYSSGAELNVRIIDAGPVGPSPITNFLFAIATTDGVSGAAYTNFLNLLRVCVGCGGHFTPPAFNAHLHVAGNTHVCGNHPSHAIVSCVESAAYGELLRPSAFALGRPPGRCHTAPYQEFGYLTALGSALASLDTKLGLPDDIFQALRLGLVPCPDCARIRTVHAHIAHRPDGCCEDVGPCDSSCICIDQNTVAEIGSNGQRRILTVPDA